MEFSSEFELIKSWEFSHKKYELSASLEKFKVVFSRGLYVCIAAVDWARWRLSSLDRLVLGFTPVSPIPYCLLLYLLHTFLLPGCPGMYAEFWPLVYRSCTWSFRWFSSVAWVIWTNQELESVTILAIFITSIYFYFLLNIFKSWKDRLFNQRKASILLYRTFPRV